VEPSAIHLLFETASASLNDTDEAIFVVGYLVRGPTRLGFGAKKLVDAGSHHGLRASLLAVPHLDPRHQPRTYRLALIGFHPGVDPASSEETIKALDALGEEHLAALAEEEEEEREGEVDDEPKGRPKGDSQKEQRREGSEVKVGPGFRALFNDTPAPGAGFSFGF